MTKKSNFKKYFLFVILFVSLVIAFLILFSDKLEKKSISAVPDNRNIKYREAAGDDNYLKDKNADTSDVQPEYKEVADEVYPGDLEAISPYEDFPKFQKKVTATNGPNQTGTMPSIKAGEYTIVLGADKQIQIPGFPGELRVWIGSSEFSPNFSERMTQDEKIIPALGKAARVEPFAPAFKIEPEEIKCIKIHPSGSEVRFKLIPKKSGSFYVGANVFLFDSLDCTGSPIPKTAATLKVIVKANKKEILFDKAKDLWDVFWQQFLEFWAAFVAISFALILFLIRGKLKQWFGFNNK